MKQSRSRIDALLLSQSGIPSVTRHEIEKMQLERLNALLASEKEREGFYGSLPEKLRSLSELCTLPFTTDEDLARSAPGLLLCSQSKIQRVLSDATSGTTGAAKRVFYTLGDCKNTVELFMAGLGELVFPGSVTMICMPFSGPYGLGELIAEAIEGLGARPLRVGNGKSYGEISQILEEERPDTFVGFPVQLLSILRACGRGSLERALVSGDSCADRVIKECEGLLGTRIFPHYGSREMALGGAITCQAHAGMHLRENHVIAEIIDEKGNSLPRGEWGELVITTIGMEAMPLIRYRTGDRTRIIPGVCPCGSEVLRLDTVSRAVGSETEEMDGHIFAIPGVIDYCAENRPDGLSLQVLSDGSITEDNILRAYKAVKTVSLRRCTDSDRALYKGKRIIRQG